MKLRSVKNYAGGIAGYAFYCPGCDHDHVFFVTGSMTWEFNGDREAPTFSPSLRNTAPDHIDPKQRCCHLVLTAGKLHYQSDCTHDLAGQEIDLAEHPRKL